MECDLYNVGKALGDLNDLDQHVNWLCKALEQRGGEDKRARRRSPGHPKSKCGKICVKPNAPGKGSMEGQMLCQGASRGFMGEEREGANGRVKWVKKIRPSKEWATILSE